MDCKCILLLLSGIDEIVDDLIGWGGPVQEVQVEVLDAVLDETALLVGLLVQPDH